MATILAVDDHPTSRDYLATLLGYHGHRVLQAADGAEALEIVRKERPDLVIADVLMPTMDGFEFVRQVRNEPDLAATPIIFLSASYHRREAYSLAEACGVSHLIEKPADPEEIISVVDQVLGREQQPTLITMASEEFDREHVRLVNNRLVQKVEELESLNARLAALIELGQQVATERDMPSLLSLFCQTAREVVGARYTIVGILEPEGSTLSYLIASGLPPERTPELKQCAPNEGLLGQILDKQEPCRLQQTSAEAGIAGLPRFLPGASSFLGVPIASHSQVYGWFLFGDKIGLDHFSIGDEKTAAMFASQLAICYENARLVDELYLRATRLECEVAERQDAEKELRVRSEQHAAVSELTQRALGGLETASLMQEVARLVAETLEADLSDVLELLPQHHELVLRAGMGWKPGLVGRATVAAGMDMLPGFALLSSRPVIIENVVTEARFQPTALLVDHQVVSSISVTIGRASRPFGVLGAHSRSLRSFSKQDVDFLWAAANLLATAIERKQLEEELRLRVNELADADRRKDQFLAMLAHELRNPLAPILNAMEVIRLGGSDPDGVERAREVAERQVRHMARLIDDLLDVSRITLGRIHLRKEVVDLSNIVTHAVEITRGLIEASGHQLSISLPPEPIRLEGDAVRLEQVLANLLHNAAKYTEPGGQISLAAEREGVDVVLRVRDSGIGISPALLPRVFDLFTQADKSLARSKGGLGIGLTLVRSLVEMHGGSVSATSPGLGQGSEFVIRLPVRGAAPVDAGKSADSPVATACLRVLVVDDHVDSARSLAKVLKLWGHESRVAHSGPAALDAVSADVPDLVLLDIGLPGMDGYEVAREIRSRPSIKALPLVALTGYGQEEDRRRSQEAGFNHHLVKPVDLKDLRELLARPEWSNRKDAVARAATSR